MKPQWTLFHNSISNGSRWLGITWEFYDDEVQARNRYDQLVNLGYYPTMRPYYSKYDRQHLAAWHLMNNEG